MLCYLIIGSIVCHNIDSLLLMLTFLFFNIDSNLLDQFKRIVK